MIGLGMRGASEVAGNLKAAARELQKQERDKMHKATLYLTGTVQRNRMSGQSDQSVASRSGRLRASMQGGRRVEVKSWGVVGFVGTPVVYGVTHEEGRTIRPRNAQWLTIPTQYAPSGTARAKAPRVEGLFFARTRSGGAMLARREGGGIVPYFWLVKEVTIPARHIFSREAKAQEGKITDIMGEAVTAAVRRGNGG